MNIPQELKYTNDHEWVKVEGKNVTVGITDYAQGELGDVVYLDIEDDIEEVTANESFGTIEAVKTVSELYAPVSGKVIDVNRSLNDAPETVNNDPYGDGWMIKIEMTDESELDSLIDADAYKDLIED